MEDADLPALFGRYTLLGILGEGGMARVFRAELQGPSGFRKRAAVKIIHATVAKKSEKLRRALINEARLGGLLHHPNIVDTYEFGEEQGLPFIAMELVRGIGLDVLLEVARPVAPAQAVEIAIQICSGLDHAHSLEDDDGTPVLIVHRDLKPSNVLLSRDGLVKVMDFGIAKAATNTYNTTETGMTKGTPAYMSPEQAEGVPLDGRSDIFALGALLYELVSGERLFQGETMVQVLMAVLRVEQIIADDASWASVEARAPGLRPILNRCLRKERADRYGDCLELEAVLKDFARTMPAPTPLKSTVRGLMAEHGLGGGDPSSSMRIDEVRGTPSGVATDAPAAGRAAEPSPRPAAAVGPTRAQLQATPGPVPRAEALPLMVQAPATPAAVPAAPDVGTLWDGAQAQPPRQSRAIYVVITLLMLLVAGVGYIILGSLGDDDPTAPNPTPVALVAAPADSLSEPMEVLPTPAPVAKASPKKDAPPKTQVAAKPPIQNLKPPVSDLKPGATKAGATRADPAKAGASKPVATKAGATPANPSAKKAGTEGLKPSATKATPGGGPGAPAFDPDDPNLVVEHARVSVVDNSDGTWAIRFVARVRGARGATAKVYFNPPGAGWVVKPMRTRNDVTFVEKVTFKKKNLGKTYWYVTVTGADGKTAHWGSASQRKKFEIKK